MNPELERNLWLELTRRRVIQMVVVLALLFLTFDLASPRGLSLSAQYLFYGVVVVWGTSEAAQAVVGEIRDRTWDFQRLSAQTPFAMIWGKLLGATSYVWLGGFLCLAVFLAAEAPNADPVDLIAQLFYFLALGLTAQAAALFASLVAIRRRQTHSRLNVLQYQAAGLLAAWFLWSAWQTVKPDGYGAMHVDTLQWWGFTIDARGFFLASLGAFLAWTLTGCTRLMRLELQMRNRPLVWTAFLAFMALYVAGFGGLPTKALPGLDDAIALRLALACVPLVWLTYLAILFEPKDRVLYRWMAERAAKHRWMEVASRLQGWMIAYASALTAGTTLALRLAMVAPDGIPPALPWTIIAAGLGFLTRDLGIFLFFGLAPGRRGDSPALVVLGMLYLIGFRLLSDLGVGNAAMFLFPARDTGWAGIAIAWGEAFLIWYAVVMYRGRKIALPAPSAASAGS